MPKTTTRGTAKQSELPDTLKRSPAKAQRTFAKAHDSAVKEYGEGERAHRVAYAALKHNFERPHEGGALRARRQARRQRPLAHDEAPAGGSHREKAVA